MKRYVCLQDTYDGIKAGEVAPYVWEAGSWFYKFKIDASTYKAVPAIYVENNPKFFERCKEENGVQYSDEAQAFNIQN